MLTEAQKFDLLYEVRPVVFLHPDERFYPASIDYLLLNSALYKGKKLKVPYRRITRENLLQYQRVFGHKVHLRVNPNIWCGEARLSEIPFYVHVMDETPQYLIAQYILIYAYNGSLNVGGCCRMGAHEGDIEFVQVWIDKEQREVEKMYFSQHSAGMIESREHLLFYRLGKRPMVYAALHSHANYPARGTWDRIFCLANDHTEQGMIWNPHYLELISDHTPWNNFSGTFGKKGPPMPKRHKWWNKVYDKTKGWFSRVFCPCL